ncbi:glycoside hydrolase family 18 protein [Dyella subtropica]|uniref:glycoside hydrolase family 18 protein n=1 Tax=Dyella subtropica TaxID=2992127 RepID=UPI0022503736|nr:glycoside hydrolase family 18 protein [Dyella subtropica]
MREIMSIGRSAAIRGWAVAIALLFANGLAAEEAEKGGISSYHIVGYVADASPLPPINAHKLDVINYAFGTIDDKGDIVLKSPVATSSLATLTALRKVNPQLKVVLSVGGWTAGHFSEAALTDDARQRFAEDAAKLLEQHDLDGLDIDWEYPTLPGGGISHRPEDKRNFSLLLETARARLDQLGKAHGGRHYVLTIAAADSEFVAGIELERAARSLDWINLMTYDFHNSLTPTTGHHAGLYPSALDPAGDRAADKAVRQFMDAGVPARKLILGVPFYGRAFTGVDPAHDGLQQKYAKFSGAPSWRDLVANYIDKNGYTRHWDAKAQVPYLWNPATRTFVSYDDPQSLRIKMAYVKTQGLGGVMYWEQSLDSNEQLIDVLVDALHVGAHPVRDQASKASTP